MRRGSQRHHDAQLQLARAALDKGARLETRTRVRWELSGDCLQPVVVSRFGRPAGKFECRPSYRGKAKHDRYVIVKRGTVAPMEVLMVCRCRKCAACLMQRKKQWTARALSEGKVTLAKGARIWLATLTCAPLYLYQLRCKIEAARIARCQDSLDAMKPEADGCPVPQELYTLLDRMAYRDVQLYIKRLRKAGNAFSFLAVTERTPQFRKDGHTQNQLWGNPHYHILFFETDANNPMRKEALRTGSWAGGYAAFSLVKASDPDKPLRPVAYVCKYAAKELARVRASEFFGASQMPAPEVLGSKEAPSPGSPGTQYELTRPSNRPALAIIDRLIDTF